MVTSIRVVAVNQKTVTRILFPSQSLYCITNGMLNRDIALQKVKHARKLLRNVQLYDEMDVSS